MQTHDDRDYETNMSEKWIQSLRDKAKSMVEAKRSEITSGRKGEKPYAEWEHNGVVCRHLPPDEHGILRISIGGGEDTPIKVSYCVFRGNRIKCLDLLHKAIKAMEER